MTPARVVVTGAAGFIGSRLCGRLLTEGYAVVGIDNFDPFYGRGIKERALTPLRGRRRLTFHDIDVRDTETVRAVIRPDDVIVHLAARPGVRQSLANPALYERINVRGTSAVLQAAREGGVQRIVFASSSSVYGDGGIPFFESHTPLRPRSPYGETKRSGERLCHRASGRWGARIACLRFFSVYGPGQRPDQAIHRFARRLVEGRPIERYGAADTMRDYTYVDDAVNAVLAAIVWTASGQGMEVFNVGSGRTVELQTVLDRLECLFHRPGIVRVRPGHPADAACTLADLTKSRRVLGYEPAVSFDRGLEAFLQWFEVAYGLQSRAAS